MGYETSYELSASDPELLETIMNNFEEYPCGTGFNRLMRHISGEYTGTYTGMMKWYDHESEMMQLSLRYSSVLFTLGGQGENHGDVWRKYFLNGLMQRAAITFEPFDSAKLAKIFPKIY